MCYSYSTLNGFNAILSTRSFVSWRPQRDSNPCYRRERAGEILCGTIAYVSRVLPNSTNHTEEHAMKYLIRSLSQTTFTSQCDCGELHYRWNYGGGAMKLVKNAVMLAGLLLAGPVLAECRVEQIKVGQEALNVRTVCGEPMVQISFRNEWGIMRMEYIYPKFTVGFAAGKVDYVLDMTPKSGS
jgi:hypothetical protein